MPSQAELLQAEIDQMDTIISNRKNQHQVSTLRAPHHHPYNHHTHQSQANARWPTRGNYYPRGRGRGVGVPQVHRHKTLIVNGATNVQQPNTPATSNQTSAAQGVEVPSQSWISIQDRHRQLINPAIYQKEAQTRAKAMEDTRLKKLKLKDEREKRKLTKHFQHHPNPNTHTAHEITIQDVKFHVNKDGSKLQKVPGDANAAKATPKTALVGGVLFHRSKNGNMYRATVVKAQGRKNLKKINEPCKMFSTTGLCTKGSTCRYLHEADKVAVCKVYLMKGDCTAGDSCDLSHDLTPERTPACLHFSRGYCSKENCRYPHVHVGANAPVCRAFAIYGYCEKGATCAERHVYECPDFSSTGSCNIKGCKLPHIHKANVLRRNTATVEDDANSDLSSDDDHDEIDSDDVDSDDMDEEFFGGSTISDNNSIARQDNFVHL